MSFVFILLVSVLVLTSVSLFWYTRYYIMKTPQPSETYEDSTLTIVSLNDELSTKGEPLTAMLSKCRSRYDIHGDEYL